MIPLDTEVTSAKLDFGWLWWDGGLMKMMI